MSVDKNEEGGVDVGELEVEIREMATKVNESSAKLRQLHLAVRRARLLYEQQKRRHEELVERVGMRKRKLTNFRSRGLACTDYPWSGDLRNVLESKFNVKELRPLQLEGMNLFMSGKSGFLVMPTGAGKSLCFQAPSCIISPRGLTLVVTPTLSLIHDQVKSLVGRGVNARALTSETSSDEVKDTLKMVGEGGNLTLLYLTPERLVKSKRLKAKLEEAWQRDFLKRLVIDEVHCASEWGHDFRPDYRELYFLTTRFNLPFLGVTATASQSVLDDVAKQLMCSDQVGDLVTFRAPSNRANLFYHVLHKPVNHKECMKLIADIIKSEFPRSTGIIYCMTRNDAEKVSHSLNSLGVVSLFYHGDVGREDRIKYQDLWMSARIQVMVATVAFGLGINKDDVRFIFHHSLTKSVENYYQESGRAGRDSNPARCYLLYRLADVFRISVIIGRRPQTVKKLYDMMGWCTNVRACRRREMMRLMGEEAGDEIECNAMCDICSATEPDQPTSVDIGNVLEQAQLILWNVEENYTSQQLINMLTKRNLKPHSTLSLERCIGHLLQHGYLCELDHFTPYNTISYLKVNDEKPSGGGGTAINLLLPSRELGGQEKSTARKRANKKPSSSRGERKCNDRKPVIIDESSDEDTNKGKKKMKKKGEFNESECIDISDDV